MPRQTPLFLDFSDLLRGSRHCNAMPDCCVWVFPCLFQSGSDLLACQPLCKIALSRRKLALQRTAGQTKADDHTYFICIQDGGGQSLCLLRQTQKHIILTFYIFSLKILFLLMVRAFKAFMAFPQFTRLMLRLEFGSMQIYGTSPPFWPLTPDKRCCTKQEINSLNS